MDRKTFIEKIKLMLSGEENKTVEVKQMEAKLADGSVINVEPELAVGANVLNADGQPLPDGMYELEDGSSINVQAGLIIEVVPMQQKAEEEKPVVEQQENIQPAVEYATKEEFNSLLSAINELKEKINLSLQAQVEFSSELDNFKTKPVDEKITRKDEAKDNSAKIREELRKLDPNFEKTVKLYSKNK